MKNPKIPSLLVLGMLLLIFIGGCIPIDAVTTEIALQPREKWQTALDIVVAPGSGLTEAQLESELLNQFDAQTLYSQGVQVETDTEQNREGQIIVHLVFTGQGLDLLNQTLSGGTPVLQAGRQDGRAVIVFEMSPIIQSGMDFQLTLKGGRVISSNGVERSGNTVTWTNPGETMRAVLAQPSLFDALPVVFLIAGAVLALAGLIGLLTTLGGRR